ncbi:regulator of ime2 [Saxophila tyrrhenica]|uniref:Regulator of ime2 n=1 Tax=Saxophila tyrrhenica TaxID=1690608 RepID=A0AAV9NWM3_9PEZI|nr:regulator of ime2 [Saxophila tyrrhenica]
MLRPATPLTIIFFLAFVLLLLSTLTTPIIQGIPLASYQGYNLGVFGWCKNGRCLPATIGYSTDGLFTGPGADDFSLPQSTRNSLSSILIVHPIAALLTLICTCLGVAAHFHAPSSSPRYLLALLIFTIPTLLVTLLAFLVDILLFVPHMNWGGWIVLAATILIIASSVVTCAMRRTLVSRKARKKRIEENADMNGSNYYNNLNQTRMMTDSSVPPPSTLPRADSPPPMSVGTADDGKGMPQYAAFEMKNGQSRDGTDMMMGSNDDRTPLNPTRDPSIRSHSSHGRREYMQDVAPPPMPMGRPSMDSQGRPRRPSRDQYGNPMGPPDMNMPLRHRASDESFASRGSRGRRGGYGPAPRGYGAPRGGYGPPRGGSYGPRGGFRGGPPPPGWRGRGGYGPPPPGMRPPRPAPPPGYSNGSYYDGGYAPGPRSGPSPTMEQPPPDAFVAGPMIGQAIEMDERTGSPAQPSSPTNQDHYGQAYGLRDSDADVAGLVGLQQDRSGSPMRRESDREASGMRSPTSMYSSDQTSYVPPRAQWGPSDHLQPQRPNASSPLASNMESSHSSNLSPIVSSAPIGTALPPPRHRRAGSEPYYEDVDPRFAVEEPSDDGYMNNPHASGLPTALTPGGMTPGGLAQTMPGNFPATPGAPQQQQQQQPSGGHYGQYRTQPPAPDPAYLHPTYPGPSTNGPDSDAHLVPGAVDPNTIPNSNSSQENLPDGARSPNYGDGGSERASEASHFTSISERPVNPNWRPASVSGSRGPGSAYGGGAYQGGPPQRRREDVILGGNPDFSIPGMGPARGGGRTGNLAGVGRNPGAGAAVPGGRYPTDI